MVSFWKILRGDVKRKNLEALKKFSTRCNHEDDNIKSTITGAFRDKPRKEKKKEPEKYTNVMNAALKGVTYVGALERKYVYIAGSIELSLLLQRLS